MATQNIPPPARAYVGAVIVLAFVALAVCAVRYPVAPSDWLVIIPGLLLTVGGGMVQVPIAGRQNRSEALQNASISLSMVPTFLLLLTFGPFIGALAGVVAGAISSLYPKGGILAQALFNVGAIIFAVLATCPLLIVVGLADGAAAQSSFQVVATGTRQIQQAVMILAAGGVYFVVNSFLVVIAIFLSSGRTSFIAMAKSWRNNYLWMLPTYLAGATAAALIFVLVPNALLYWQSSVALLALACPIPFLIYYTAKYHRDRNIYYSNYIQELERGREELRGLYTATVESFALAIDAKDRYTQEHIQRVKAYALDLAREMSVSEEEYKAIEYGALLHDIGKIAIPESILCKPGKLTPEEFETMKTHTVIGAKILEPVRFPFPVISVVRSHHERWDGTGYPDALSGEQIPIGARILAVTDVYDALTTDRSYRRAWSRAETMTYLQKQMGTHFDPRVVSAFLRLLRREDSAAAMIDGAPANIEEPPAVLS